METCYHKYCKGLTANPPLFVDLAARYGNSSKGRNEVLPDTGHLYAVSSPKVGILDAKLHQMGWQHFYKSR